MTLTRLAIPLLAAVSCLGLASGASAFAIRHEIRGGQLSSYQASDSVVVDVLLVSAATAARRRSPRSTRIRQP